MFNKTRKVLLSFSICLCLMATFIASNRTTTDFELTDRNSINQKTAYASVTINIEGKKLEIGLRVSTSN